MVGHSGNRRSGALGIECCSARRKATYKAWFPLTGRWLGFEDAHITFEAESETSGTFNSRPAGPGEATSVRRSPLSTAGGWVSDGLILTAISVQ